MKLETKAQRAQQTEEILEKRLNKALKSEDTNRVVAPEKNIAQHPKEGKRYEFEGEMKRIWTLSMRIMIEKDKSQLHSICLLSPK
jgi:hypothetical protein